MNSVNNKNAWTIDDINYDAIDVAAVRNDEMIFMLLASASFVEILSQTYAGNLVEMFSDDPVVTEWLSQHWGQEETQHGVALKRYVNTVWPEFDWERGHKQFCADYGVHCTTEELERHRALELMARCVVETGTSTFYRAVRDYTKEPVLRDLIDRIRRDEVYHYNFFRRHFASFNSAENHSLIKIIGTIVRRLLNVRGQDAYIAFKHVYVIRNPGVPFAHSAWRNYNRQLKRLAQAHYPFAMAVKMLITPLPLRDAFKPPLIRMFGGFARFAARF